MQDSALNAGRWELAHVQEVQVTGMGLSRFSTANMADVTDRAGIHQGSQKLLQIMCMSVKIVGLLNFCP